MISLLAVVARVRGVDAAMVQAWVEQDWVRPRREDGRPVFEEIDVARVRLIAELRELEVGDGAIPVVLSLLDQVHATRAQMRRLCAALDGAGEDTVRGLLGRLRG